MHKTKFMKKKLIAICLYILTAQAFAEVKEANNQEIMLPIALSATPVDAAQVRVSGTGELDVGALGYQAGIEALREIAGLKSISLNVPIDFVLTFQK